jgi:hypothetical protein
VAAQQTSVAILVADVSKVPLVNAEVHLVDRSSKAEKVQVTGSSGAAVFEVNAGSYRLLVTKPGFRSLVMPDLDVKQGEHRHFNFILEVNECYAHPCGDADPVSPSFEPENSKLGDLEVKDEGPQDYCSLRVRVVAPNGVLFPVDVTVYERNGRKIEREQTPPDAAQFCDLGISPVKVVVGTKGCHEITMDEVQNYWREPYTLTVTYDPEHCIHESPPPPKPLCKILFRISDTHGEWIDKASITFKTPLFENLETDSAGRALLTTDLGKNIRGIASAPGYTSKAFSVSCGESDEYEKALSLVKR